MQAWGQEGLDHWLKPPSHQDLWRGVLPRNTCCSAQLRMHYPTANPSLPAKDTRVKVVRRASLDSTIIFFLILKLQHYNFSVVSHTFIAVYSKLVSTLHLRISDKFSNLINLPKIQWLKNNVILFMNLQCDQMWQEHLMSTPLGFYWGGSKPEGGGGMESCDTFLIHMSGLWARKTQIAGGWTSWGSTGISMWSRLSLLGLYIIGASWSLHHGGVWMWGLYIM